MKELPTMEEEKKQPEADEKAEQPVTEEKTEQPNTDEKAEESKTEDKKEEPKTEGESEKAEESEKSKKDEKTDKPEADKKDKKTEKPKSDKKADKLKADEKAEESEKDEKANKPKTEEKTKKDKKAEQPTSDKKTDKPKKDNKAKSSSVKGKTVDIKMDKKMLWIAIVGGVLIIALAFFFGWMLGSDGFGSNDPENGADGGDLQVPVPPIGEIEPNDFEDFDIATVDGTTIRASDVSFLLASAGQSVMMDYFDMYPDDAEMDFDKENSDGVTFGRMIREEAVRLAAEIIIWQRYAQQIGIMLDAEDMQMIDEQVGSIIESYGWEELYNMGIQDADHLVRILEQEILLPKLVYAIIEDPSEFARFEQYMVDEDDLLGAKHILINYDSFESEEEAEAFAQSLLERARDGEDFDELIAEYGEDPGMMENPDGYTFASGEMMAAFEEATRELEIGEISDLVMVEDWYRGIHIIMRVEPTIRIPSENDMIQAVLAGFEAMVEAADIVFLPKLDDVVIAR